MALLPRHHTRKPLLIGAAGAMMRTGIALRIANGFTRSTGIAVRVLPLSARTTAFDVVFTHGRANVADVAEQPLLTSDLVIVGPPADPAGVSSAESAADAFRRIAISRAAFVPAPPGTEASSLANLLWRRSGFPRPQFHAADSFSLALATARKTPAYMLIDRPSFYRFNESPDLAVLYAGDSSLRDTYFAARLRDGGAGSAFWKWLRSPGGRSAVHAAAKRT